MTFQHPDNEKELLAGIAEGDALAFRRLYDSYRALVYGVALKLLKSPALSEDIVQEVFIKIWRNREKLGKIACFKNYLFRTTRNRIFDEFKKMDQEATGDYALSDLTHACENADFPIREEQLKKLLKRNLYQLPRQQQTIYRLSRDEGKSYQEIADELNISPVTVKTYMKHTLAFLRRHLAIYLKTYLLILLTSPVLL